MTLDSRANDSTEPKSDDGVPHPAELSSGSNHADPGTIEACGLEARAIQVFCNAATGERQIVGADENEEGAEHVWGACETELTVIDSQTKH